MLNIKLKIAFWLFVAGWAWAYAGHLPPENFLWTCNICLIITAVSIAFSRPRLPVSVCLLLVALPDIGWAIDVFGRLVSGVHPIGGTEYMFNPSLPLYVRLFSFEHILLTPVIVATLWRSGYDRRALPIATVSLLALYYLTYAVGDPALEVNWVWGLFGDTQTVVPAVLYPAVAALMFTVLLSLPTHFFARRYLHPREDG